MAEYSFNNIVVFVLTDKTKMVPLRLQFFDDRLVVLAKPYNGEMGEREALELINSLDKHLNVLRVSHTAMSRKTEGGRRLDAVSIPWER